MRIERGQHAVDRGLDQLLVVRRLDVVVADALEHLAEQVELLIGVGGRGGLRPDARGMKRDAADDDAGSQRGGGEK
jgi:hypothetical protein